MDLIKHAYNLGAGEIQRALCRVLQLLFRYRAAGALMWYSSFALWPSGWVTEKLVSFFLYLSRSLHTPSTHRKREILFLLSKLK